MSRVSRRGLARLLHRPSGAAAALPGSSSWRSINLQEILILAETGGGLRWLALGTPLAFLAGVGEAWVLRIEIER